MLYEERKTPHAGIGMFAKGTIPPGTRIICEEALISLPDEADILELYQVINALPADKQTSFWELSGHKHKHDVDWIATLRSSYDGQYTACLVKSSR